MDKKQVVPPPQPTEEEKTIMITANVTPQEKEFLDSMASLLSEFKANENGDSVIKENNVAELIRMCLSVGTNTYLIIFPDSKIITRFKSKKAMKEYIAFRAKYMNMPVDTQKTELRNLGIVKAKS